jgi:hypothetical protein
MIVFLASGRSRHNHRSRLRPVVGVETAKATTAPYFAIATFGESVLKSYGLSGGLASGVGLSSIDRRRRRPPPDQLDLPSRAVRADSG